MKFRVGLLAGVCVIGFFGVNASNAADISPPPPPPQYVEVVDEQPSCFYARADVGGSFHQRPTITKQAGGAFTNATDERVANHAFVEAGAGCRVVENMRIEVTGGYRFKASLTEAFGGIDADLETYTGFLNAFWDITNYNGFTPYIGGGVGFAHHRLTGMTLPVGSTDGSRTAFAYNIGAGISYDITDNLMLDVAYRYVDLGYARSKGATPMTVDNLNSHEIKVGMRYHFGQW